MTQTANQIAQIARINAAIDTLLENPNVDDPDLARAAAFLLYSAASPNLTHTIREDTEVDLPPRLLKFHQMVRKTIADYPDYPDDVPFPMTLDSPERSRIIVILLLNVTDHAAVKALHTIYQQSNDAITRWEYLEAILHNHRHHSIQAPGVRQTVINDPDDHLLARLTERARQAHLETGRIIEEITGRPLPKPENGP